MKRQAVAPPPPYAAVPFETADAAAIQALARGDAEPDQQQRALEWIIEKAAGTYDLDYRPDARDHAFASGMRNVGLHIITLLKVDIRKLREADKG